MGEGSLVVVAGYITSARIEGIESVNCRLVGSANSDIHIALAPQADSDRALGIVAEVIPQARPAAWSSERLRQLAAEHRQVKIAGQLLYDSEQRLSLGGSAWRRSLWE